MYTAVAVITADHPAHNATRRISGLAKFANASFDSSSIVALCEILTVVLLGCVASQPTLTADTVIAYITHDDQPNLSLSSSRHGVSK